MNKTYNREGAIAYAKRWWNAINPKYGVPTGGQDCANFVSQCIHEGGGLPMKLNDIGGYRWCYGKGVDYTHTLWKGAGSLKKFFLANAGIPRLKGNLESNINNLQSGDICVRLTWNSKKSKWEETHVSIIDKIINGVIYVYGHTQNQGGFENNATFSIYASNHKNYRQEFIKLEDTMTIEDGGEPTPPPTPANEWETRYGKANLVKSSKFNQYVKNMQEDLNAAGFPCGTPDGYFGNNTLKVVKNFQRSEGLTDDGIFGDLSKAALWAHR